MREKRVEDDDIHMETSGMNTRNSGKPKKKGRIRKLRIRKTVTTPSFLDFAKLNDHGLFHFTPGRLLLLIYALN